MFDFYDVDCYVRKIILYTFIDLIIHTIAGRSKSFSGNCNRKII